MSGNGNISNPPQSSIVDIPRPGDINPHRNAGGPTRLWVIWFDNVYNILFDISLSGTTSQRPAERIYIGKFYYDTTISKPIWVNSVVPTVVWKDAMGNVV